MLPRQILALVLVLFLVAPPVSARTVLKPGWNLFSKQQDLELGRQASQQVEKQTRVVDDAALTRYISDLGRKLSRFAPDSDYPFTFKVVQDKNINAFALPGGPVYVNTGTIAAAENESQLAGVIGHEIGHVVMRHATNNASKAQAAQLPLAVLGGLLGSGGLGAQLTQLAASFGLNSLFLKYSRDAEKQADIVGSQMLYDAGYDPEQMARFFEKLESQEKERPVEFLSSHPNPGNRVALVRNEVRALGPARGVTAETSQFAAMHDRAMDWNRRAPAGKEKAVGPYGHDPNGQHDHPDLPASNMRNYSGRDFRIGYPENWQVGAQESVVTIAPRQGISREGISHGVLISVFEPQEPRTGRMSLSEATRQLVDQLRQSNPGMRVVGSAQRATVGGLPGQSVTLAGRSPVRGETEVDWLVTALRPDGSLWYAVFIAPERDFSTLRPSFTRMLESVQLLN